MIISLEMAYGQKVVIKARDLVTISYGFAVPVGAKSISGNPALLTNMQPGQTASITYLTNVNGKFYAGAKVNYAWFNGWNSSESKHLYNTASSFTSLSPVIEYRGWSPGHVFGNKFNFIATLSSGVSRIQVDTNAESEINEGSESNPLQVKSLRFCADAGVGVGYIFSNTLGVQLLGECKYTQSNSTIFSDERYVFWSIQIGASRRLFKDKRYKFSN